MLHFWGWSCGIAGNHMGAQLRLGCYTPLLMSLGKCEGCPKCWARSLVGDLEKALSCHWTSAALAVAVVWEMNQQMGALFLPLSLSL